MTITMLSVRPDDEPEAMLQESNVRYYSRAFPALFAHGRGAVLTDDAGNEWLDFLLNAGALNYGHNHPALTTALIRYIERNGVVSSLDLRTTARQDFLAALNEIVLAPRHLDYVCQFCGHTGTNTVEAAIKLARKVTGRKRIVSFSNSFHGMSAGSMSASASLRRRNEQYMNADWLTFLPFDGFTGLADELQFIRAMLTTPGSGISAPAAFIVELVQGEGGVNVASKHWVQEIYRLAKELGAVFIVDDIQAGCGRTGRFFSFEHHGIVPDLVCLSKSISGLGLPMGLLLLRPDLDVWSPGEHSGTFRGFNYAFVTATEALRHFWAEPVFLDELTARSRQLRASLRSIDEDFAGLVASVSHLGMFGGIRLRSGDQATAVQQHCFDNGLIVETCGPDSATIKLMPPLTIGSDELESGLSILRGAMAALPT